jgi:hypothetical protein
MVEKIWLKEVLGANFVFWKSFRTIVVNTKSSDGFGIKI